MSNPNSVAGEPAILLVLLPREAIARLPLVTSDRTVAAMPNFLVPEVPLIGRHRQEAFRDDVAPS
jgi:hypothetical protein